MKVYNVIGYSLITLHISISALFAPQEWGALLGATFGLLYLVYTWFLGGVYLSDVIHMGIAHKTLNYKPWFIKLMTILNNTTGIYINPVTWVNRHRHHHAFSDHNGDPNKLDHDGFWRTMYLCIFPYDCQKDLASDRIFQTIPFRIVSNKYFAVFSQACSYGLLWLVVRDWSYALLLWCSVRVFALWINMIQNYWTHDRRFGTRRYSDDHDNAMNLGEWLPVTASFSASLQNNHHHYPHFLRTSHEESEYDFGFLTVKIFKMLGLVAASPTGAQKPEGIPLQSVGF